MESMAPMEGGGTAGGAMVARNGAAARATSHIGAVDMVAEPSDPAPSAEPVVAPPVLTLAPAPSLVTTTFPLAGIAQHR